MTTEKQYAIESLDSWSKWYTTDGNGTTTVTYTFDSPWGHYGNDSTASSYDFFNTAQRDATRLALQQFENVANVSFTEVAGGTTYDSQMVFREADLPSDTAGWAYYPSGNRSDVVIDNAYDGTSNASNVSLEAGNFGFLLLMHEIGHAMGLKHPHSGYDTLTSVDDSVNATVMSYYSSDSSKTGGAVATRSGSTAPQTLQIYDIAALQAIYGANYDYNAGDTTYSLTGDMGVETIWDGGGTDTITGINYTDNGVTIDLREGLDNITHVGNTHHWIAFDANIEDAEGSIHSDTLYGNDLDNKLNGRNGSDTLYGGNGRDKLDGDDGDDIAYGDADKDTIIGGSGSDSLFGGGDNDRLHGNTGNDSAAGGDGMDTLYGNDGDDILHGDEDNDLLNGGKGLDTLTGGEGDDTLNGNTNNDILFGGAGQDSLSGNDGNDYLYGEDGQDVLIGGKGADTVDGGLGNDTIKGNSSGDILHGNDGSDSIEGNDGYDYLSGGNGNDTLLGGKGIDTLDGGADNDELHGDTGNDILFGGAGNDTLEGGAGNDTLTGNDGNDIFYFSNIGFGTDTITDFQGLSDKINLSGLNFTQSDLDTNNDNNLDSNDNNISLNSGNLSIVLASDITTDTIILAGQTSVNISDIIFI